MSIFIQLISFTSNTITCYPLSMQEQYDESYYQERYIQPVLCKLGYKILCLWISFFCLIKAAKLKKGANVLDFGCGLGSHVWALRKLGMNAYGVDSTPSAKNLCKSPDFCRYSIEEKLPFTDNHFDLVYSNEVLEHLPLEKLESQLRELQRVSKGHMIHIVGVTDKGPAIAKDRAHLIIENEAWWKKKFLEMGYKVTVGNPFYFHPSWDKISKKGYFVLEV